MKLRRPSGQVGDSLPVVLKHATSRILTHEQSIVERHGRVKLVADFKFRLQQHAPRRVFEDIKSTDIGASDNLFAELSPGEGGFAHNG